MHVIGTAGHVDHGKSTLIAALTGVHPDRLREEREREMTIDLGFGWLLLPNGETVGIVDVPGHRDFIENMLAGVGGIDAALFVVAADEGVMPQTREHLAILDLLQIERGIVVLTKIDLAPDSDWLDLVETDVRDVLRGTVFADAPVVRVSARTGEGLDLLKNTLAALLEDTPSRADLGRPRLPVDRVFTMAGFGTVVTGTLVDGSFHVGDEIEILPSGQHGRIRGLQTHRQKENQASPGSRTAVNISGLDVNQIQRGAVLTIPHTYHASQRLDVQLRLLADATSPLKHGAEVKIFIGAAEVVARARVLGSEQILPGEQGYLQLELRSPVVAVRDDRYILRRPSPGETLGGGVVLDADPRGRHKRQDPALMDRLAALTQGTPTEVLLQAALALGIAPLRDVVKRARLETNQAELALREALASGQLLVLEKDTPTPNSDALAVHAAVWSTESSRAEREVANFHQANPLRVGIPREMLKSRLKMSQRGFQAAVKAWLAYGKLLENGQLIHLPDFMVRFSPQQQTRVDALLKLFAAAPYSPPSVKDCVAAVGEDLYNALVDQGELVAVSPEVVFRKTDFQAMVEGVRQAIQQDGSLSAAQFRDLFNTSRKYALAFLEYADAIGVTVRDGDVRKLGENNK
ncbi:MAG TPA: selenocysteine-specific translation elongation factor [Bellilinea sp.]|nr:selenocysteine-specific translation elongation factor [Bellilinea sp.]